MEKQKEKQGPAYKKIIWDYIDAVNAQVNIVRLSYKFLSAKIVAESKKVEEFIKDHGEVYEEEGNKIVKMPIEHGAVFSKMMRNLDNTARAFDMSGVNAVIGLVSRYDGLLGELTKQMFVDKPEILNSSDREFKASEILAYADFNEVKEVLVEKEIESLLRKSHIEQFQWLGNKLNIELKKFKLFPEFVEIMERRNLFVHCNGLVSRQYLLECKKNNVTQPKDIKLGDRLTADFIYVRDTYKVLFQVGIMLGFVLWYKIKPEEGDSMMESLSQVAYDLIRDEEYELCLDVIDFALANKSWSKEINSAQQLVFRVNKALTFHLREMQKECEKITNSIDLTAAEPVYHLAVAVLNKDYDKAYNLMAKIGKDENMRVNYKVWPLFKKIRQEKAFIEKYKEIYCEEYECNDTRIADFEEVIKSAIEMVKRAKETNRESADVQDVISESIS